MLYSMAKSETARLGYRAGGDMRMYRFALAALICAAVLAPPALGAQTYPTKPLHLILPYVPGGIIDTAGRNLALAERKLRRIGGAGESSGRRRHGRRRRGRALGADHAAG